MAKCPSVWLILGAPWWGSLVVHWESPQEAGSRTPPARPPAWPCTGELPPVCPAPSSDFAAGLGRADECEMGSLKERTMVSHGDLQTTWSVLPGKKVEDGDI